jgi:hypothetical protein
MSIRMRICSPWVSATTALALGVWAPAAVQALPGDLLAPTQVRWTADQVRVSKEGDALLIGHVRVELPVATSLDIHADRATRFKDGSMQWEGNVRVRLGDFEWTTQRAAVGIGTMTPNGPTTVLTMEQVLVRRVSGSDSPLLPADISRL